MTWLPWPNFAVCAWRLSDARLREALVSSWRADGGPIDDLVVQLWEGHRVWLGLYRDCMLREWVRRGYTAPFAYFVGESVVNLHLAMRGHAAPPWLGDQRLHEQHRRALCLS